MNPWREIQYAKYSQTVSIHGVAHKSPALKPLLSISATPAPTLVHHHRRHRRRHHHHVHRRHHHSHPHYSRHHHHHVHPHSDDEVGDYTCEAVNDTSIIYSGAKIKMF